MTVTDTEPATWPATRGEKLAGVAGAVVGVLILLICVDLASGGKLSGLVTRKPCGCADAQATGDDNADG